MPTFRKGKKRAVKTKKSGKTRSTKGRRAKKQHRGTNRKKRGGDWRSAFSGITKVSTSTFNDQTRRIRDELDGALEYNVIPLYAQRIQMYVDAVDHIDAGGEGKTDAYFARMYLGEEIADKMPQFTEQQHGMTTAAWNALKKSVEVMSAKWKDKTEEKAKKANDTTFNIQEMREAFKLKLDKKAEERRNAIEAKKIEDERQRKTNRDGMTDAELAADNYYR